MGRHILQHFFHVHGECRSNGVWRYYDPSCQYEKLTVSTSARRLPGMIDFCTRVAPRFAISPSGMDPLSRLFDKFKILRDFILPIPKGIRPGVGRGGSCG